MISSIFLFLILNLGILNAELSEISFNSTTNYEFPYNLDCFNTKVSRLIDKGGDYTKIYDLARDICADNVDSDLGLYFENISKEFLIVNNETVENLINCMKFHLLKLNATGELINTFDKNLLITFNSDDQCDSMISLIHDGPTPDDCTLLAPPFHGNLKAAVLSAVGNYSEEIYEAEKRLFIEDTKFQWNFHLNCLIENQNNKI